MKHYLQYITLCFFSFFLINTQAQVSKMATNCNISQGISIGSVDIMVDFDGHLWKTDGTMGGTSQFTSKATLDYYGDFIVFNGKFYFTGIDASSGSELWVTDGTDAGTKRVSDIEPGTVSSSPENFIVFNNKIYFYASTTSLGKEIWMTDGSAAGTTKLKDINPGSADSHDYTWGSYFINGNTLYFVANDGIHGNELWKTNGTESGTTLVKDIYPNTGSSEPGSFTLLNGFLYFSADDGSKGQELWKSDGSSGGTSMVKDITNGSEGSSPSEFLLMNNKLYFITVSPDFSKYQLWVTDGTGAGTKMVFDFGATNYWPTLSLCIVKNNKFYFDVTTDNYETETWVSDGTTGGTTLFKNINPSGDDQAYIWMDFYGNYFSGERTDYRYRLFNGKFFLNADDGVKGSELWISDGTTAGTVLVKDIYPGAYPGLDPYATLPFYINFFTQSRVYFAAQDATHGIELWSSDGTTSGTNMVKDIRTGSGSSFYDFVTFFNGHIYFSADENGDGDYELFKVDQTDVLPLSLLDFTATLNGKAAQLNWTTINEINTKDFTIQRSYDSRNFENIGSVIASGKTAQKTNYQFTDAGVFQAGISKVYYRLQMNDNDGQFTYSKVVSVNIIPQEKIVTVWPNPVKDYLNLTFNIAASEITVKIIDQNGKMVYQQQLSNVQPGSVQKVNTSSLKNGVYYVQWNAGSEVQSIKIIKY